MLRFILDLALSPIVGFSISRECGDSLGWNLVAILLGPGLVVTTGIQAFLGWEPRDDERWWVMLFMILPSIAYWTVITIAILLLAQAIVMKVPPM